MPQLLRSSLLSMIGGFATAIGGFVSAVIIARTLEVGHVGDVTFYQWVITVAAVVTLQGRGTSLERFIPGARTDIGDEGGRALAARLLWPVAAASLLVAVAFLVLGANAKLLGRLDGTLIAVAGFGVVLQTLANFYTGYLRGALQFETVARQAAFSALLQISGVLIGGRIAGPAGALAGFCLGFLIPAWSLVREFVSAPRGGERLSDRISRFAYQAWLAELIGVFVWTRVELLFLQMYTSSEQVAYFAIANSFANLAVFVPMFLSRPLLPHFSAAGLRGDEVLQRSYASSTRVMCALVMPACFGLAALAPSLLPLLYGARFEPAVVPAVIVTAGSCLSALAMTAAALTYAAEKVKVVNVISICSALVAVVAGFTVIPYFGATGAAVSRLTVQLISVVATIAYLRHATGMTTPVIAPLKTLLSAVVTGLIAFIVSREIPGLAGIAIAILIGIVTYGGCLLWVGGLAAEDAEHLAKIERVLPGFLQEPLRVAIRIIRTRSSGR